MHLRIITSVALAAGLALSLSACEQSKVAPTEPTCGGADQPPCPTAGPARTDGGTEQQK